MTHEPLSPELALVDPELGARARAALPDRMPSTWRPRPTPASAPVAPPVQAEPPRAYPFWARVTAALWLVVIGILIGGAAIPHAQDEPRIIPPAEDAPAICVVPQSVQPLPTSPPGTP